MDWAGISNKWMEYAKKYRYVLLVVLAGIFLMALPEGEEKQPETVSPAAESTVQPSLAASLEDILGKIEGAGKVQVLLTQAEGEQTLYQTDEDITTGEISGDIRRETVIITDGSRGEAGLIRQVNPPTYLGAIVLCQGADSAKVRLAIVEAVSSVTALSSDSITVLKMK